MSFSKLDYESNDSESDDFTDLNFDSNPSCSKYDIIKNKVEKSDLISNPFYPNHDMIKNKFDNGNPTNNDLFKEFGYLYMISLQDNSEFESYMYDKMITKEQLSNIKKIIVITPTTSKILSGSMKKYLTICSPDIFNTYNVSDKYGRKVIVSEPVLICNLIQFKHKVLEQYLNQYEGISSFIDIYNSLLLNEFFGQDCYNTTIKQNHFQMINCMNESNYFTIKNNCELNITYKFESRTFNLSLGDRMKDETVQKVLKKLEESKLEDNNYLAFLFRKANYLDASSALSNGYKLYRISNNPLTESLTKENFNTLFNKLSFEERYYMIMNCMISKDLSHLIINNQYILKYIIESKDTKGLTFMNKYGQLIRYLLGYAWLTMYMEESIKKSYITTNSRFIFDIETASLLPYYPYSIDNLHICPYLPILIRSENLNSTQNILGANQLNFIHPQKTTRYGVTDKQTFIERLNTFVSGLNSKVNVLENVNFNNIAISGSIMACCLPNFNTIMVNFMKPAPSYEVKFLEFATEYYKDADIDIMCNIPNIHDFVDKINEFKKTVETNLIKIHNIKTDIEVTTLFSNKSGVIMINKDFIKTHISHMDYTDVITNINTLEIKTIVYKHYINWHKDFLIKSLRENPDKFTNPMYHEIYDLVPIDQINVIFIKTKKDKELSLKPVSDISDDVKEPDIEIDDIEFEKEDSKEKDSDEKDDIEVQDNNIAFIPKINYKFRISSPYLPHNFELFQTKYPEFFATVSRFHLPIVRSYYDGNNIYMTPSCITACMTLINIDYKYFAGSKDPIEIINKYRMRGFGTILNEKEIGRLIEYSNMVPKWKELYDINIQSNTSVLKILGHLSVDSKFFKPSMYLEKKNTVYTNTLSLYCNIVPNNTLDIIRQIKTIYNTSNCTDLFDMSKLTTINNYGYVSQVKKWLIQAFYDTTFNKI